MLNAKERRIVKSAIARISDGSAEWSCNAISDFHGHSGYHVRSKYADFYNQSGTLWGNLRSVGVTDGQQKENREQRLFMLELFHHTGGDL
jgi:hypothetical protein